jgi:hypothetical protein
LQTISVLDLLAQVAAAFLTGAARQPRLRPLKKVD